MLVRARASLRGLAAGWRGDRAVRELWLALALGWALLALVGVGPLWWALVLAASVVALALEHLNTAIEALLDRLHPEHDAAVGAAKDLAAAAALGGDVAAGGTILLALAFG
jgi:diacylglycerol kinase